MTKRYCAVNDWLLDVPTGSLVHLQTGERKRLGEYQLKLLDVLTQNAGKILSRDELTNIVWEGRFIGNNSLPNAIHALRVALEDDGKQQRIIRTIQKKGYILDEQYCQICESPEQESEGESPDGEAISSADQGSAESLAETLAELPQQAVAVSPELMISAEPVVHGKRVLPRQRWLKLGSIIALLILLVLAGGAAFMLYSARYTTGVTIDVVQEERNSYSNISLFKLSERKDLQTSDDGIYRKLKETLYTLNQEIKARKAHMNIYYHVNEQELNYTFSIENGCYRRQLAMTIYHWRVNNKQLNSIIYRETERRLNELSDCTP